MAGGRPKGSKNLATRFSTERIAEVAKKHGGDAIRILLKIAKDEQYPAASRVAACNSILDRGYGKAVQGVAITGLEDGPVLITIGGEDQKRF